MLFAMVPWLQGPRRRPASLGPEPGGEPVVRTAGQAAGALRSSFHRTGFVPHELPSAQLPYAKAAPIPLTDSEPHDDAGVRVHRVGSHEYDHPVGQSGFGLYNLESYVVSPNPLYLERAAAQADRLIRCATVHRGAWFLPYPFGFRLHGRRRERVSPPWYSGMAQGKVLSLFVRLAEVTGQRRYREAADRVFASFLVPRDRGGPWVTFVDEAGCLWLEEYPAARPDRTFNGHMFAAWGLWDYWRISADDRAAELWDGALSTVCAYFSRMRNPDGVSNYCLGHEVRSPKYHGFHIAQLRKLHQMSRHPAFAHCAEQLVADFPSPDVRGPVDIAPGAHTAFRFDRAGRVTDSRNERVTLGMTVLADQRGRMAGQPGHWYRIVDGAFAGFFLREEPASVVMRGEYLAHSYDPPLRATLAAGVVRGCRFDAGGSVTGTVSHTPAADTPVTVGRISTWNSVRHALAADGAFAGYWVPTTALAFG